MKSLLLSGILGFAKISIISKRKGSHGLYQTIPGTTTGNTTPEQNFLLSQRFQGGNSAAWERNEKSSWGISTYFVHMEAMQRILSLTMEKIRSIGIVTEDVALALVDSIMNIAIDMLQTGQRLFQNNNAVSKF